MDSWGTLAWLEKALSAEIGGVSKEEAWTSCPKGILLEAGDGLGRHRGK